MKSWQDLNDIDEINDFGIIPSDGILDGEEPYTDDEMDLMYQDYLIKEALKDHIDSVSGQKLSWYEDH